MNKNIWEQLEIAPTNELRTIKKAYATRLKTIHPDDHPKEFQALKEAFDQALSLAKRQQALATNEKKDSLYLDDETMISTENSEFSLLEETVAESTIPFEYAEEAPTNVAFPLALQRFIADGDYFYNLTRWQELVEEHYIWSIDAFQSNTYEIQLFLTAKYMCLSKEILDLLFSTFDLNELTSDVLQNRYVLSDFIYLRKTIYEMPPFSFQVVPLLDKEKRESYLRLRYDAYLMLEEKQPNPYWIREKLQQCLEITTKDSDIYSLLLLTQLQEEKGFLFTQEEQSTFKKNLSLALASTDQTDTIRFLQNYLTIFDKETTILGTNIFDWDMDKLIIPNHLSRLLLGQFYFAKKSYSTTYALWSQLPSNQLAALMSQADNSSAFMNKKQYKEMTNLKRQFVKNKKLILPPKVTKNHFNSFQWVFLVIILIFIFGITISSYENNKNMDPSTLSDQQTMQSMLRENLAEKNNYIKELLQDSEVVDQFIQLFYLENNREEKEAFIESATDNATPGGLAKSQLEALVDQDTIRYDASVEAFTQIKHSAPPSEKSSFFYHLIYKQKELVCVVKTDWLESKIVTIYGTGWEPLTPERQQEIVNFAFLQPKQSLKFFVNGFLFATPEARRNNLEKHSMFMTNEMKQRLLERVDFPKDEDLLYQGTIYYDSTANTQAYFLLPQEDKIDSGLILVFDEEGRLANVYGKDWENHPPSEERTLDDAEEWQSVATFYREEWPLELQ